MTPQRLFTLRHLSQLLTTLRLEVETLQLRPAPPVMLRSSDARVSNPNVRTGEPNRANRSGPRPTWTTSRSSWSVASSPAKTGLCGQVDWAASYGDGRTHGQSPNNRFCTALSRSVAGMSHRSASSQRRRHDDVPPACGGGDVWQ